jgi:hypothetical protein
MPLIDNSNLTQALTEFKTKNDTVMQGYIDTMEVTAFKEISNPLTSTDISQESPVGSVIEFAGLNPPNHYLKCDGLLRNIADYQTLATYFKTNFGSYNYFGGDGLTTFAIPKYVSVSPLIPFMTSNTAPYGTVISDGTLGDATGVSSYGIFLNDYINSEWDSMSTAFPHYIGYEFTKNMIVNSYSLKPRIGDVNDLALAPKTWTFQGSNDGTTWVTLDTRPSIQWRFSGEEQTFKFNNITAYKKYRMNITANNGYAGTIIAMSGLQMYCRNINKCIKYEPTYYAVNQYGGFDETILFDGSLAIGVSATLNQSVENYDCIYVYNSWGRRMICSHPNDIATYGIIIAGCTDEDTGISYTSSCCITYANNVITVKSNSIYKNFVKYVDTSITKIVGVKGQLSTLLQGGTF